MSVQENVQEQSKERLGCKLKRNFHGSAEALLLHAQVYDDQ